MSARSLRACIFSMLLGGGALAERPPEALEAEQRAQAQELDHLVRKADALSGALVERRAHLRLRLRELYKLSQGGYVRLLLGAESPADLFARRDAARRILGRDLAELDAVREELAELNGVRERLREGEQRAAELAKEARETVPTGLARKHALYRPVGGPLVARFGPYPDPETGVELSRDGVELHTTPGDAVRAAADGEVRTVGELPGLGICVVVDHGDGWSTLLARLASPKVRPGQRVHAGERLADAAGATVQLQLMQGGMWLDPAAWLAR
jgi:septal ring factor EnvC (AmiA/AmiB activator)